MERTLTTKLNSKIAREIVPMLIRLYQILYNSEYFMTVGKEPEISKVFDIAVQILGLTYFLVSFKDSLIVCPVLYPRPNK